MFLVVRVFEIVVLHYAIRIWHIGLSTTRSRPPPGLSPGIGMASVSIQQGENLQACDYRYICRDGCSGCRYQVSGWRLLQMLAYNIYITIGSAASREIKAKCTGKMVKRGVGPHHPDINLQMQLPSPSRDYMYARPGLPSLPFPPPACVFPAV